MKRLDSSGHRRYRYHHSIDKSEWGQKYFKRGWRGSRRREGMRWKTNICQKLRNLIKTKTNGSIVKPKIRRAGHGRKFGRPRTFSWEPPEKSWSGGRMMLWEAAAQEVERGQVGSAARKEAALLHAATKRAAGLRSLDEAAAKLRAARHPTKGSKPIHTIWPGAKRTRIPDKVNGSAQYGIECGNGNGLCRCGTLPGSRRKSGTLDAGPKRGKHSGRERVIQISAARRGGLRLPTIPGRRWRGRKALEVNGRRANSEFTQPASVKCSPKGETPWVRRHERKASCSGVRGCGKKIGSRIHVPFLAHARWNHRIAPRTFTRSLRVWSPTQNTDPNTQNCGLTRCTGVSIPRHVRCTPTFWAADLGAGLNRFVGESGGDFQSYSRGG